MANKKHLAKLKKGIEAWNEWRENNPNEKPDLVGANLKGKKLTGANFSKANFSNADIRSTDFTNANLSNANLSNASLQGASFNDAKLTDTNFIEEGIGVMSEGRRIDYRGILTQL